MRLTKQPYVASFLVGAAMPAGAVMGLLLGFVAHSVSFAFAAALLGAGVLSLYSIFNLRPAKLRLVPFAIGFCIIVIPLYFIPSLQTMPASELFGHS